MRRNGGAAAMSLHGRDLAVVWLTTCRGTRAGLHRIGHSILEGFASSRRTLMLTGSIVETLIDFR
jgi:hypothetical protein